MFLPAFQCVPQIVVRLGLLTSALEKAVENDDLDQWHAEKLFNVATSAQAADFLMCNAKARHEAPDGDYPYLMLTVGLFGSKNLFNQTPMKFKSQEAVKELIDMLGSMRPTVEA